MSVIRGAWIVFWIAHNNNTYQCINNKIRTTRLNMLEKATLCAALLIEFTHFGWSPCEGNRQKIMVKLALDMPYCATRKIINYSIIQLCVRIWFMSWMKRDIFHSIYFGNKSFLLGFQDTIYGLWSGHFATGLYGYLVNYYEINVCDAIKWNEWVACQTLSNFSFVIHLWKFSESYVLMKTSSESDL